MVGRLACQRPGVVVLRRQLDAVAVGLLEVVAEHGLVRDRRVWMPLEPARQALVQLGSRSLGKRAVRRVPDQGMVEREALAGNGAGGGVRAIDQLAPGERTQRLRGIRG